MKKGLLLLTVTVMSMLTCQAEGWQRLSARLMTPWGEQIDPENVWQEYPRPQLVRQDWMNLNGVWGYFRRDNRVKLDYEPTVSRFRNSILVPFGVESALSGIMHEDLGTVAKSTLMYRRTFQLTPAFTGKTTLLHFGAVDWRCAVYVNGEKVGEHDGGSDPFTFDITHYLKAEGEQELQVAVYDPSSGGGQPRGKQTTSPSSIWYTSCSGIWQTVWLEPVNDCYIQRYEVVPDAATGTARVKVIASDPTCKFYLVARDGEEVVATTDKVRVGEEVTLSIPNAKLWSPDSPFLYNLDIYLCRDNCQECDRARGYFGLRTFTKALVNGQPAFMLNGQPLFMIGPLDQGWWPDGLLTPPSYEAMIYDLQTIKKLGMNAVRKHIKVENDLWYEWCDRNGLIVWQDMPSGSDSGSLGTKEEIHQNFYRECENIVTALKQHPCIGLWVPFNEGWGQDANSGGSHTIRGYVTVRKADADTGRMINSVSGWTDFEIGDVLDCHSYPAPNANNNTRKERVNVCGEYGGITYMIEGHLWAGSQQVYTSVESSEEYTECFNQYLMGLQTMHYSKGLWAGIYTQITDVEQEVNGILTYDRKVLKVNDEQLASIRSHVEKTITQHLYDTKSVVSAGDNAENISWYYTTQDPGEGWEQPDYNERSWKRGPAGFGSISQSAARVRTTWDTPEIWIRRKFKFTKVKQEDVENLCLRMFYDEDSEVYINGVHAMSVTGYNTSYQFFNISDAARATIDPTGYNVIAIHTKQTTGGQYIDAGFSLCTYKGNDELTIKPVATVEVPQIGEDPEKAYLLTYTVQDDNNLYYSYSFDGLTWQPLHDGLPVFGESSGQFPIQGPFVCRMEDEEGKPTYHLLHGVAGKKGLCHWISDDLLTWQPVNGTDAIVLGDIKALSPELFYDKNSGDYFYYWTGTPGTTTAFRYSRTSDFVNYTKNATLFETTTVAKDLHVFPCGEKYVALYAANGNECLYQANSSSLDPSVSKFASLKGILSTYSKVHSPFTLPTLAGDGWLLVTAMGDYHELFYTAAEQPSKLRWRPYELATCAIPADMNEGKVLIISRAELDQLQKSLADGIHSSAAKMVATDDAVYNLAGQRIARRSDLRKGKSPLPAGVYITKGQKKISIK